MYYHLILYCETVDISLIEMVKFKKYQPNDIHC